MNRFINKFRDINKYKGLFLRKENILKYFRTTENKDSNSVEDILISYELQSGSYTAGFFKNREIRMQSGKEVSSIIEGLGKFDSIMEAGVGEATTLAINITNFREKPNKIFGFDISWSRLKYAKKFLRYFNVDGVNLFVADIFNIPLFDNSIDVVYTFHSIESNKGREKKIIKELYRVARKYVILFEPMYELVGDDAKKRMEQLAYAINLSSCVKELGYTVLDYFLFKYPANVLNPTGVIIIKKDDDNIILNSSEYRCPVSSTKLKKHDKHLLTSIQSHLSYPVIQDIPCLLQDNAIFTYKLSDPKIKIDGAIKK